MFDTDDKTKNEWPLKKKLDAFGNIFGLNVCFVIASIPIFTIGAALTATYSMAIKLEEGEEETILRGFINDFKKNFKQSTFSWLLVVLAIIILYSELLFVSTTTGFISIFYTCLFFLEALFLSMILAFLFPLIARYDAGFIETFKNAFLLSMGYLGSWIKIVIAWVAPIAFSIILPEIFLYTWYLWLLLIFGAIIYGTSYTVRFVFKMNQNALDHKDEEE